MRELLRWQPELADDVFVTRDFLDRSPEFVELLAETPVHALSLIHISEPTRRS